MSRSLMKDGRPRSPFAIVTMAVLALLWTIPTLGLLVDSFRSRDDADDLRLVDGAAQPVQHRLDDEQLRGGVDGPGHRAPGSSTASSWPSRRRSSRSCSRPSPPTRSPSWTSPFKEFFFLLIIAVMVVPIQVAFQPMLNILGPNGLGISGQYIAVWLLHTGFGMPLATTPCATTWHAAQSVIESAKIDG